MMLRIWALAIALAAAVAAPAMAGDPVPGTDLILEHAARPGPAAGDRPATRLEAVTNREGMVEFSIDWTGLATLFVTPNFEGEAILRIEGRDISVPIRGQGRGAGPVRAAAFEVRRGERLRVQVERPDRR